jgi:predicted ABC-type ATPase
LLRSEGPTVHIVAGPNGAGKTTFVREFLPVFTDHLEFVNVDLIAQELAPVQPTAAGIRAARQTLSRLEALAERRQDFAFETTLSGRTYLPFLRDWRQAGYQLILYFLWLPDVETALRRVAERVRKGGHAVPDEDVRRRFSRGITNLFRHYRPLLDVWMVFENSGRTPVPVAVERRGKLGVLQPALFDRIRSEVEQTA